MRIGFLGDPGETAHIIVQHAMIFHIFHREAMQVIHRLDKIEIFMIVGIEIPRLFAQPQEQARRNRRFCAVPGF